MASVPLPTGAQPTLTFQALLTEKFDYTDQTVVYHGWAFPGTSTSTAAWLIQKQTLVAGQITDLQWANGIPLFNVKFDDRASITYG